MDPEFAKVMARRRRKADGVESDHARATVPLEEPDSLLQPDTSGDGANEEEDIDPLPPAKEDPPPETPPTQKRSSIAAIKERLYSPNLLDKNETSGGVTLDKSEKSAIALDESDNNGANPTRSSFKDKSQKSEKSSSESITSTKTPRLKRQKSTTSEQKKNRASEISDMDAVVAAANALSSSGSKKTPPSSPGQLKKTKENSPKSPPPPPTRTKSKSSRHKSESAATTPTPKAGRVQRRKSNDGLTQSRSNGGEDGGGMDDASIHRRLSRRKSNDSQTGVEEHRRFQRRNSNDSSSGHIRPLRRFSNDSDTGSVHSSSGHRRARRRSSNDSDMGNHDNMIASSVHSMQRRAGRRNSSDHHPKFEQQDEATKSPTKQKQRLRTNSDDNISGDEVNSPGRLKGRRQRSSSGDRIRSKNDHSPGRHHRKSNSTDSGDPTLSPTGNKEHRRRGPSRSTSRTEPSKRSTQRRPKLPSTLEAELASSWTARSKKKKSPRHKMPTTLEEELVKKANRPTSERSMAHDELSIPSRSNRSAMDVSNSSKRKGGKRRGHKNRSELSTTAHEEYEENLREPNAKASGGSRPSGDHNQFMFNDSSNFDTSFVIDMEETTTDATKSQAFDNDNFASFNTDFGSSFADGNNSGKPVSNRKTAGGISKNSSFDSNKKDKKKTDAFGFESGGFGAMDDFGGKNKDNAFGSSFADDFGSKNDFGGDWKPQISYDKSPIEKPPMNQVESMSTKIKWITPRPNLVISASSKSQIPSPVANPLNGNLIVCRSAISQTRSKSCEIVEWSPQKQAQVLSVPILTSDMMHKVLQKYSVVPESVDTVWTISTGIHRTSTNTEAIRVAALIDFTVLGERNKEILRLIAVWNWGHYGDTGSGPVLQSVLSPPSGSDFTYDTKSLKVADGCIFVAGASAKGPCVFLNKPTVRETWSANFIAKNTDLRITNMAVTNASKNDPDPVPTSGDEESSTMGTLGIDQRLPYLAIALNDGSLSVWTYDAAMKINGKSKEAVRKLIFPLCRLHAIKVLTGCPVTPWSSKDKSESEKTHSSDATELGICTHLEWVPYRASAYKQLSILAASFQGALCLYHVALPKVQDKVSGKKAYIEIKPPSEKTVLNQTISLRPFCFSKWPTTHHRASCAFVDLGPHVPPTLTVFMRGSHESPDYARIALVTCPLHAYNGSLKGKSSGEPVSFHVWDSFEWKNKKATNIPRGLIHSSFTNTRGILYHTDNTVQELEYRTNTRYSLGASGSGSIPCGLTTSGGIYSADSRASSDVGVLSLYTTYHCERFKSTLSQDASTPTLLEWTIPVRRHWLVQTFAGDSKDSKLIGGSKGGRKANDDIVLGGAQSTLVCELVAQQKVQNIYPYRLARNPYSLKDDMHVAIWFRSLYGNTEKKAVGLVGKDGDGRYGVAQVLEGRDVVFLPPSSSDAASARAIMVSRNGGTASLWKHSKSSDTLSSPWKKISSSKSSRPILGVDSKDAKKYVELRQYVTVHFQSQLSLVAVASGSNNKFCLIAGTSVEEDDLEDWTKLIPNIKENPVLWLEAREQISLVVPLPAEGSIKGGLGVATTRRIMILSPDLKILAAVESEVPPGSLVPMGSFTIAYMSSFDHKLRYLSGLPSLKGQTGVIANLSVPFPTNYAPWLVGIRPDRFIFNIHQNGTRMAERGQPGNSFLLPLATTRPALLLEPMIANAICTGGKDTESQPFLRTVMEKFGRKVATMSHGDDEGIGNSGAGITPQVFELLEYYGLKAAASWLLTGTVRFDRSANSRLLPSYLPVNVKAKAAFDADTHMHLIASGDQYFTEYVKSPDNNMSSTLPRPSDPTAALCRQFGRNAIREGKIADAIKMLDISGSQSSDAMILQVAMVLRLDSSKDSQSIIDALHQQDSLTGKTPSAVATLAALATELNKGVSPSLKFNQKWLQSLAPSVQRSRKGGRHRSRLLGESTMSKIVMTPKIDSKLFSKELPESKLVWNEGPNGEKENLLMLDNIGEWLGRKRPIIFGKEGAKRAEERGASTLAGILHSNDDDSFGGDTDDDFKDGWVDGVGEGLKGTLLHLFQASDSQ